MEDRIKTVFDSVHMSDECAATIAEKLENPAPVKYIQSVRFFKSLAAVAATIVLVLTIFVVNADYVDANDAVIPNYNISSQFYIHNRKTKDSYFTIDLERHLLTVKNGRVFFIVNGENIDITDQINTEEPFVYTFTDVNGLYNLITIGGELGVGTDILSNVGFNYYAWFPDFEGDGLYNNGIGGCGRIGRDSNGLLHQWYQVADDMIRDIRYNGFPEQ